MKKSVPNPTVLCSIVILIAFFSISNRVLAQAKAVVLLTEEAPATCFVQLNDGSIQQYSNLKLVTGVLITPHLLADNKVIINAKDIKAYRNDKHFAVSDKSLTTQKKSLVAVETLPGFAVRIVTGKMNVYCRKYYNGSNSVDEYFLQNGNEGQIVAYSTDLMKNLLKDNAKALDYFNSKVKVSPKSKKLLATADIYNSGELFSKN
jgi:hypothetical protein